MNVDNASSNADSACLKHDIADIKLMLKNVSSQKKLKRNQEKASYAETVRNRSSIAWQELKIMNDRMLINCRRRTFKYSGGNYHHHESGKFWRFLGGERCILEGWSWISMLFKMTFLTTFISIIKLYNQIWQNYFILILWIHLK